MYHPHRMPGTYHIIPVRYRRFPAALCGEKLIQGRGNYCNTNTANPDWDYDWCHDCVKAVVWTDEAKGVWRQKGIDVGGSSV